MGVGSLPPSRDTQRKTRAKADGPLEEEQLLLTLLTGTIRASHSAPQTRGQAEECVEGKGPCRSREGMQWRDLQRRRCAERGVCDWIMCSPQEGQTGYLWASCVIEKLNSIQENHMCAKSDSGVARWQEMREPRSLSKAGSPRGEGTKLNDSRGTRERYLLHNSTQTQNPATAIGGSLRKLPTSNTLFCIRIYSL